MISHKAPRSDSVLSRQSPARSWLFVQTCHRERELWSGHYEHAGYREVVFMSSLPSLRMSKVYSILYTSLMSWCMLTLARQIFCPSAEKSDF